MSIFFAGNEEMKRRCRKVLWLNPVLACKNYEPLCKGMQAVLPHLDYFLPTQPGKPDSSRKEKRCGSFGDGAHLAGESDSFDSHGCRRIEARPVSGLRKED